MNENLSKPNFSSDKKPGKTLNFREIEKDYKKYGYLEDYQVEYLLYAHHHALTTLQVLMDGAKQLNISSKDEMEIVISRELYNLITEKLNSQLNNGD